MGPGCDVYALGVILYQLLTGRLPFQGSMVEVLGQIVNRQPEPPSKYRPDLDLRLEAVCLKALNKKVGDRYASMRDLGAALTDCLRCDPRPAAIPFGPVLAAPGQGVPAPTPWLGRKLLWWLLGGVGAAAIVLASMVLWSSSSMGTIRIDLDGPRADVEVQLDGEPLQSAGVDQPFRLRPGKHHLLVTGKTIQPISTSFTVAPGDNPVLRVQLALRPDAVDPVTRPRGRRHDDDHDKVPRRKRDDDDPYDD
jgi:hypothetical protein